MEVEVRAGYIETRDGIKAKRGDTITIPAESAKQSPSIRQALKSGNLRAAKVTADLPATGSTEATDGTNVRQLE
jgi:hypothetical protein